MVPPRVGRLRGVGHRGSGVTGILHQLAWGNIVIFKFVL